MTVQYKVVRELDFDPTPRYAHEGDAGADLYAAEQVSIGPGESALVPTGIAALVPKGYEAQIRPRSGLALKNKVTVLNAPGTIDNGYVHEWGVILINHGDKIFTTYRGDRIAQVVFNKFEKGDFEVVTSFEDTDRKGGFGSTGI